MHEQTAVVRLPLEGPIFALVEDWRRSQPKIPSRNEAIRLLLRRALERSSAKSEAAVAERDGAADPQTARASMTRDNSNSEQKNAPPKRGKLRAFDHAAYTRLRDK
jgi:hypothetical protein